MPPKLPSTSGSKSPFWRRLVWLLAAFTLLPLIRGLLGTVIEVITAFDRMGLEAGRTPDDFAADVSLALMKAAGGLAVSILLLPIFPFALVKFLKSSSHPARGIKVEQD